MKEFDYIIVGAGSAGCVLAHRLTEELDNTVLLVEAGGPDYRLDFRTQMPAALSYPLQGRRYNWAYTTEPEPHMNNRRMECGRGKGLGGSSLINGMIYIRGNPLDFDRWSSFKGLEEWSYLDCLPYFKKMEKKDIGANDYHGDSGPLHLTTPRDNNILFKAMVDAGIEAGFPRTDDVNGYRQEGLGPFDRTTTTCGRRASTSRAYLDLAKKTGKVTILTHATTNKVLFSGKKATGVEIIKGKQNTTYHCAKEVIICAGAIDSPLILQRSGVGSKALLSQFDIPSVIDLPGVGANLQDHLEVYMQYECLQPVSIVSALKWYNKPLIGMDWLFLGRGIGASNQFEAGGFIKTSPSEPWPNIQYHFLPIAVNYNGSNPITYHSFQFHVGSMRSESMGRVQITSKDPLARPSILFNYMSTKKDWEEFRAAIRITRDIASQNALKPYKGKEIHPGIEVQSDREIDEFVKNKAETAYHPCGSCQMGYEETSVVDKEGKIHGLEGIRVADASIMPRVTTGNLNAPTIMIAEKIADQIKGRKLPKDNVSYFGSNIKTF